MKSSFFQLECETRRENWGGFEQRRVLVAVIVGAILSSGLIGRAAPGDRDASFDFALPTGTEIRTMIGRTAVQKDGKVLVCTAEENSATHRISSGEVLRLNADGSLDASFNPPKFERANGAAAPYSVAVQGDGKILVSGLFDTVNGFPFRSAVRLDTNGDIDETFVCEVEAEAFSRALVQPDGKILLAGTIRQATDLWYGVLVRLNQDGTRDNSFGFDEEVPLDPFSGQISDASVQSDGKIVIAGSFGAVHGVARKGAARLHADGSLDTNFEDPRVGGEFPHVSALALQPDGKVLIGGTFTSVRGVSRRGIARLDANGSLDATFLNPGLTFDPFINGVLRVALQKDGRILLGGTFQVQTRTNVARLNPNGTVDLTFQGLLKSSFLNNMSLQQDGRILVSGSDCTPGVGCDPFLVRLHAGDALPSMSIERSGGSILLSWPVAQSGEAVLEATDALTPQAWNQDSSTPVVVGDRYVLSIPEANGPRFFRLRK